MKSILLGIILCVNGRVTLTHPTVQVVSQDHLTYKDSYFEDTFVEDVVPDLAGRQRAVIRDLRTDRLSVHWVKHDTETRLPYIEDPQTKLPYLLLLKAQDYEPRLLRMLRGKNHEFIVADPDKEVLFRPALNRLAEVDLTRITEEEAGFTIDEALQL